MIETGKTVDAAIECACEKLGCEREDCEWEIMDLPKKTFLGLKTLPARVKVWIQTPDEEKPQPKPAQPKPQERVQRPQQEAKPRSKPEKPPAKSAAQAPESTVVPRVAKREEFEDDLSEYPRVLVTEGFTDKEQIIMEYIQGIMREFGLTAKLNLYREGSGICIDIAGEGLGTIIGRRGETLDAIQYLSGLVANRLEGDYLRVTVDCGDYRTKRKDTLEALAGKLAAQVIKTNISKTLEPMNPFERRVIHAAISKMEGVSSSSIGEEPNRRVVITSPTARRPAPRGRDRDRSFDRSRGGVGRSSSRDGRRDRGDRDRNDMGDRGDREDRRPPRGPSRPPAPSATIGPPKETPESSVIGSVPLGKLDLE